MDEPLDDVETVLGCLHVTGCGRCRPPQAAALHGCRESSPATELFVNGDGDD